MNVVQSQPEGGGPRRLRPSLDFHERRRGPRERRTRRGRPGARSRADGLSGPLTTAPPRRSPFASSPPLEDIDRALSTCRRFTARRSLRRDVVVQDSDAYRVVHAEADLLPALIVDRYGDYLSCRPSIRAWTGRSRTSSRACAEMFAPEGSSPATMSRCARERTLPLETRIVLAANVPTRVEVTMNGLRCSPIWCTGRRPAFFSISARTTVAAARYAHGGNALDCFTSTGGFALHLAATCEHVEAVDSSEHAVKSAGANRDRTASATCHSARRMSSTF